MTKHSGAKRRAQKKRQDTRTSGSSSRAREPIPDIYNPTSIVQRYPQQSTYWAQREIDVSAFARPGLRALCFGDYALIKDEHLAAIRANAQLCERLEVLWCLEASTLSDKAIIDTVERCPKLKIVRFDETSSNGGDEVLLALLKRPEMESITIRGYDKTDGHLSKGICNRIAKEPSLIQTAKWQHLDVVQQSMSLELKQLSAKLPRLQITSGSLPSRYGPPEMGLQTRQNNRDIAVDYVKNSFASRSFNLEDDDDDVYGFDEEEDGLQIDWDDEAQRAAAIEQIERLMPGAGRIVAGEDLGEHDYDDFEYNEMMRNSEDYY